MALKSMKREPDDMGMETYTTPSYPSGLCLWLDDDQCEALGISTALKAGTQVMLEAKAIVTSATESLERDGDDKGADVSLSLQITDLSVTAGSVLSNAAAVLYGRADSESA